MLALVALISVQHITPVFAAGAVGISPYAKSIDEWTSVKSTKVGKPYRKSPLSTTTGTGVTSDGKR